MRGLAVRGRQSSLHELAKRLLQVLPLPCRYALQQFEGKFPADDRSNLGHLFRGESAPSTWLYAMATLQSLQRLRDSNAHQAKLETLAAAARTALGAPVEDRMSLFKLLEGQPEDVRLIVYLRYVDELTMEEVAEIVGYSRKTVSQRLHDFLAAARRELQVEGAAP